MGAWGHALLLGGAAGEIRDLDYPHYDPVAIRMRKRPGALVTKQQPLPSLSQESDSLIFRNIRLNCLRVILGLDVRPCLRPPIG